MKVTLNCVICGTPFETVHKNKKYCSRSCGMKGRTKNKNENRPKTQYICKKCRKPFIFNGESRSYCSECFPQMKGLL